MLKENRTLFLLKFGTEEDYTHFNVPAFQDEASYGGDVSDVGEDDIKVILDDTLAKSSGPVKAISAVAREV